MNTSRLRPSLIGLLAVIAGLPVLAHAATPSGNPVVAQVAANATQVQIAAGSATLLQLPQAAGTVLAADPKIVRVQPASPTTLFVVGLAAGHTTVIATTEAGAPIARYEITVQGSTAQAPVAPSVAVAPVLAGGAPAAPPAPNPATIERSIAELVATANHVSVHPTGKGFEIAGPVATPADAQKVLAISRGFAGDAPLINDLAVTSSIQVNVRVRVAEISRQITRELGLNWQALGNGGSFLFGLHTGAAASGAISAVQTLASSGSFPAPFSVGAGFHSSKWDINGIIDALAGDQLITMLAEPNLTAQSGESASFLAGGEFPIPVAASNGANGSTISVEFKQFGVSLTFVPTVLGPDRINLKVRPEVSELSTAGAVSVPIAGGALTIPALTVRRAETTIELGSGQSFAIAGLLQKSSTQVAQTLPGIGEMPVLGALFRSDQFQRNESELVIIVTPYLVRPAASPKAFAAPTDDFRPATDLERLLHGRQIAGHPLPHLDAGFMVE